MSRPRDFSLALGLGVLALAPGCSPRPAERRTLTVAVRADITGLFPNAPMTNDSYSLDVNSNVFEGLVSMDAQLVPQPALAQRWENPDPATWVFHLKPNLRFSSGKALTALDVAASLNAARARKWCNEGALVAIESVTADGTATVTIRTKGPFPNLLSRLHYGFVVPSEAVNATPVPAIGSGPFRVERWTAGHELVLTRNPFFRGPPSDFESIRFQVVKDEKERIRRVLENEADLVEAVPLSGVARLMEEPRLKVIVTPGLRVVYLVFQMNDKPFSDARVREAVDLAIDREELIRRVLYGRALVATQLVTPTVAGYNPAIAVPRLDRERARRLLREAGYGAGLDIRLDGPESWYVSDAAILREVGRQLAEVGVRVTVRSLPKKDWIPILTSGGSRFFLYGWACETRDAGDALDALMHSLTADGLGKNNYQGLRDPELDAVIDEVNRAADPEVRNRLFPRALARVAVLHAIVPLEIQPETMVMRSGLAWDPPLNFGLRLFERAHEEPVR